MCPEFVITTTEEEYDKAGSKFITFSPDDEPGKLYYKDIELDMPDWDTPGQSIKFPTRITEEVKALNVTVEMRVGADKKKHPVFASEEVAGKQAVGVWQVQVGAKGGDVSKGTVKYPKLINIMPAGSKPAIEELV